MPAISLAVLACVAGVVVLSVMYSREKKAVKELNDRLLLNESRELAFHGEIMLEEGRLADAEKLALSILPKDLNNPDRPYSVDADRILAWRRMELCPLGIVFCSTFDGGKTVFAEVFGKS